jgi:hypothetical protein
VILFSQHPESIAGSAMLFAHGQGAEVLHARNTPAQYILLVPTRSATF